MPPRSTVFQIQQTGRPTKQFFLPEDNRPQALRKTSHTICFRLQNSQYVTDLHSWSQKRQWKYKGWGNLQGSCTKRIIIKWIYLLFLTQWKRLV